MSLRVALALVPLSLVLASCGGSSGSSPDSGSAPAPRAATPAPRPAPAGRGLAVGTTSLRLGDATRQDGRGAKLLAGPSRPDPDRLRADDRARGGVAAGDSCPDQELAPTAATMDAITASTLCLLNGERNDAGLPPLTVNADLSRAAMEHSRDMVAKSYFDHQAPDGTAPFDRIKAAGYLQKGLGFSVGENLAYGAGDAAPAKVIVAAWMHSAGHRANILNDKYREIGLGIIPGDPDGDDGGATYTTTFGALIGPSGAARPAGGSATPTASGTSGRALAARATGRRTCRASAARHVKRVRSCARKARARR